MAIVADVVPSLAGLTFLISVTGEDERRLRSAFDVINDDGKVDTSMSHLLNIAIDAVAFIEKHQKKVVTCPVV